MADAYVGSSGVTVPIPLNYVHEPIKLESRQRALDGSMIVNYAVTTGDQAMTKYHFELPGIIKSERLAIRAVALETGNMTYIDHIQIPEVLTCTGTTGTATINLLRDLSSTSASTGDIDMTLNDTAQTVTVSTGTNPSFGNVYITTGGVMTLGACSAGTNNLTVNYKPSYTVHILSDSHELMLKEPSAGAHVTRYNLVLEET